jgi:hypothetical protein
VVASESGSERAFVLALPSWGFGVKGESTAIETAIASASLAAFCPDFFGLAPPHYMLFIPIYSMVGFFGFVGGILRLGLIPDLFAFRLFSFPQISTLGAFRRSVL